MNGWLPLDKPAGLTSFDCIRRLRRVLPVKTIGHAGTLDPFATGILLLLIGKPFTQQSQRISSWDKSYWMKVRLGVKTTTFDPEGEVVSRSEEVPSLEAVQQAIQTFQGSLQQIPPMFSAKQVKGQRLYTLARKGITIERAPCPIEITTRLISYEYPYVEVEVDCSKGTYLRVIAHDLGELLGCGAHAEALIRTRLGPILVDSCFPLASLTEGEVAWEECLQTTSLTDYAHLHPRNL